MHVFLTGATGIVGSHLLVKLLKAGRKVRVLLREKSNRIVIGRSLSRHKLNADNITFVVGDISDPVSLREGMEGCEEVYHCAAAVSFDPLLTNYLVEVNAGGTSNVVNTCLELRIGKLCYISSTAAIGDGKINGKLTEKSAWTSNKGRSGYSLSKRYAEFEVWRGREEGLKVLIVNPGLVVGAGNWGESSTTIILSCENGMTFYPSGSNGFVSADDIARFCLEGMDKSWFDGRYLLISENLPFKRFFELTTEAFGSSSPKIGIPKSFAKLGQTGLKLLEFLRINPFSITSQNIDSAYRESNYSNAQALSMGFEFSPIKAGIVECVNRYQKEKG